MKLYCYTMIDSSGPWTDGAESITEIFKTKQECIEDAYLAYEYTFEVHVEGEVDENDEPKIAKENFWKDSNVEYIQLHDYHIQFEYFEKEI